jgi:hypothetical protein
MADQADVENALTALVANAMYPDGTAAPSALGVACKVYRGAPAAPVLDADLAAGNLQVTILAQDSAMQNTTRYPRRWVAVAPVAPSLQVVVTGSAAVFSGTCAVGQLAGVMFNETSFAYAVQASDTPATVASNLAALARAAGWIVNYAGTSIAVPAAILFTARVVSGAGALQEIKRQVQKFGITLWCPDPATRDAAALLIDPALAVVGFLPLADGSAARLLYVGTTTQDNAEDAVLYRRDVIYSAEYPTTLSQIIPAMLFGTATMISDTVTVRNLQS